MEAALVPGGNMTKGSKMMLGTGVCLNSWRETLLGTLVGARCRVELGTQAHQTGALTSRVPQEPWKDGGGVCGMKTLLGSGM